MEGKITALEIQKRDKERVNIFIDGEFAFGLNLLDAAILKKGQLLTPEEIATLKAKDNRVQAYEQAVKFLSYRIRSSAEIRDYLKQKKYNQDAVEEVIERLQQMNYLNDLEFARLWVKNREAFHPRGASALRYELRQKGIASDLIDEALSEFDAVESAYRAAQKKARSLRGKNRETMRQQLGGFLQRRGYSYDTVSNVLQRIFDELEIPDDNEE